ncbi:MAG: type I secretion system permease/ATPase [Cloacibacillus sp.]
MPNEELPTTGAEVSNSGCAEGGKCRTQYGGPLASSLLAVARFHGRRISLDAMLAGLPLEGGLLTPSSFCRAAEKAGLTARFVQGPIERLNPLLMPAVLLLEEDSSCVLFSVDTERGAARVVFPEVEDGEVSVGLEELASRFSGYAVYMAPLFKFDERAPSYEKEKKGHWFWEKISLQRPLYRDIILASVLSNLFAFAMPLFVMNVYNRVVPNNAIESLWVMAVGVFIMVTADFVLHMARGYLVDVAAARTNSRLSGDMMRQVLGLRTKERPASVGSFIHSVQGFESVRSFISSATVFAYVDLPFAIFFLAVIAIIAWPLAVPLLIGSALILLHAVLVQKQMRELSEKTNRASSLKNSTLVESLVAIDTVKTQGAEGQMQNRWEKTVEYLEDINIKLHLLSSSVVNWTQWVQLTVSIATMIIGVYEIKTNTISMGSLIAAYMLSSRAMAPISRVAGLLMQYYSTARSLAALDDIMNKETEHPDDSSFLSKPEITGAVEFKNVTFTYPEQEKAALTGVSFKINPGERVAFIGPIGSGKTTLTKLLLGFYQPAEGGVFVDGIETRQLDPAELRRNIGVVPQDVMLFFGSLRENLLMGSPGASDAELLEASRIGGLGAFVGGHPKGFEMQVGERGASLSCGQRQAVAISRAVLKKPPLLILDEPTSSMDSTSEELIKHNLMSYLQGRTLFLVTHKSSLLDLATRIIILDSGRVIADGPKEAVLAALKQGQIRRPA